jgi:hypothetical protein
MQSHHFEREGEFYCREDGGQATFARYVVTPDRISNSFSRDELVALDYIMVQLLKGAYGSQPLKVHTGLQSLSRKSRTMMMKLEAKSG